jgi:beta-glucosidase
MMRKTLFARGAAAAALLLVISGCQDTANTIDAQTRGTQTQASGAEIWPAIDSAVERNAEIEARIDKLLTQMTIEEKVGQMIQPEIKQVTPEDVKQYHLGSVLNGGGTTPDNNKYAAVDDWVALADSYWHASMDTSDGGVAIPIMWGTDAVHGLGNVIGATLFPHNSGLGAMRNPDLIEKIGEVTAREIAVTGLDWDFSPTVAVARDDRWGRAYESWSEDPDVVRAYAGRMVEGLQGEPGSDEFLNEKRVIATAKHYIGDGGTRDGIDRGDTVATEEELRDIHGAGYFSAIESGVQAVMASFTAWDGQRMHGHKYLLTDVLKDRMGFDGLVVGDWSGHGFVEGCTPTSCPQSVNAGLDIFMVPEPDWKELFHNTVQQVNEGVIPMERVNDAVRRILRVKMRAGLFEKGAPSTRALAGDEKVLGSPEHRAVARQAVRESLVMLKNQDKLLPLSPDTRVLVAGDGADNIGKQTGGWTISWQGTGNSNADFPGATSIYQGIQNAVSAAGGTAVLSEDGNYEEKPDVAIVVYGEDPYAEMQGDRAHLMYEDPEHLALLKRLQDQDIPVVSLFLTGRPLWANPFLNASDAFVVAWLPGTEGAGVADVLFTKPNGEINYGMTGKLPFSWPKRPDQTPLNKGDDNYDPLFAYGYGLNYGQKDSLGDDLSEQGLQVEETSDELQVFHLRALEPWKIQLTGGNNERTTMTGSEASLSTVAVSSVDRNVQHDSRRVQWNGKGQGAVALASSERQDLSSYLEANGALMIDVKVDTAPTDEVMLRLGCGSYCYSDINLTDELRALAGKGWKAVSVDLACFPQATTSFGIEPMQPEEFFASVYEPFKLVTDGKLDLAIADVSIKKQAAEDATISCD